MLDLTMMILSFNNAGLRRFSKPGAKGGFPERPVPDYQLAGQGSADMQMAAASFCGRTHRRFAIARIGKASAHSEAMKLDASSDPIVASMLDCAADIKATLTALLSHVIAAFFQQVGLFQVSKRVCPMGYLHPA